MNTETFTEFESRKMAEGYDTVLERVWAAGQVVGEHQHPFDADAVVVKGEFWLTVGADTRHLVPGGTFNLARNTPHSERYGSEGTVVWVARRGA